MIHRRRNVPFVALLTAGLLLAAFSSRGQVPAVYRDCATARLTEPQLVNAHSEAIVTRRMVFDTTANSFEGVVVDQASGKKIAGANLMFTQGTYIFLATTDRKGAFRLMRQEFTGRWELKIQHPDYACLLVPDIAMGGGISALLKLHRKW